MTIYTTPRLDEVVEPFVKAGVLHVASVHVVDILGARIGETRPDVLLALALVVQAPLAGHAALALTADLKDRFVNEEAVENEKLRKLLAALPWPAPEALPAWNADVRESPLVGAPESGRPFVAWGDRFATRRLWTYERSLAARLRALADAPEPGVGGAPLDVGLLRAGLAHLFHDEPPSEPGGEAMIVHPDDRQRLGALAAVLRAFTVISGGPGTGKTYTVKKILALLYDQWKHVRGTTPRVLLAAPTGKAAVRMRQAIGEDLGKLALPPDTVAWLLGLHPDTLHGTLGFQPRSPTRFKHDETNPLSCDVLIVDEASMVDVAMMDKLVAAVPAGARLILLGDRNQLASVDSGCALADVTRGAGAEGLRYAPGHLARLSELAPEVDASAFLDPEAPPLADGIVHYVKAYRSKARSGVQRSAYAIADGRVKEAVAWLTAEDASAPERFADLSYRPHGHAGLDDAAVDEIVDAYAGPDSYLWHLLAGTRPLARPADPAPEDDEDAGVTEEPVATVAVSDEAARVAFYAEMLVKLDRIRVLTGHRKGRLGVSGLNERILRGIRDRGSKERSQNAEGDASRPLARLDTRGTYWIGRPILVTENRRDIGLVNGDIGVVVPDAIGRGVRVVFPGVRVGTVRYCAIAQLPAHETVFAMTIHKSQGSQFDTTVVVLPEHATSLLTRELIYTGLTRAKKRIVLYGPRTVLVDALERRVVRQSNLGDLLWSGQDLMTESGGAEVDTASPSA